MLADIERERARERGEEEGSTVRQCSCARAHLCPQVVVAEVHTDAHTQRCLFFFFAIGSSLWVSEMAGVRWLLLLLLVPLFSSSIAAQDCDARCATKNCNDEGVCICDLPANSTMLQGDRHFMGGEYCDTPQTMCDGSNTFYCENGLCNEIIQGENYTCICKEGYAGDRCELEGTACGDSFCYHNGECNEGDGSCDCPADWSGSGDCSTGTVNSSTNAPSVDPIRRVGKDSNTWYLPVFVTIGVVAVAGGVVLGVKSMRKRSTTATEFHKLRQVQMRGFIDEDEDAFAHAPLSKAELA